MNGHASRGLGLAVGSAVLLISAVPAAAQSAAEVVDGYLAAVNAHDAGAEVAALAPDVVIYDVARDSIVVGAEGHEAASRRLAQIRDWFEEYSATRKVVERMVSDNLVMQRERWTLRFENGGTNEWVEPAIYRVFNGKIYRMWSLPREFFDPESVPPVADPAFAPGEGPVVWIDEAHRELHRAEGTYWPLAELLRRDGYRVRAWTRAFTDSLPGPGDVLVVSNALAERNVGDWSLPTPSAFTHAEVEGLAAWVRDGGGLLLIADHMPFPGAAGDLAAAFGFELENGFAIDTAAADPSPAYAPFSGSGTFTFRRDDGSLAPHPIREGRGPGTRVDSVFTDAGHAFRAPPGAAPLYRLPATTLSVRPDTAWRFSASTPAVDAAGLLQGAALEVGAGRVVVFGEAAQFRPPIGDLAGDNGRYARNVIAWLAGALEPMTAEPDTAQASEDPYIWLEDVEGERAMTWVESQNAKTLAVLSARPEYRPIFDEVQAILESDDRIAYPSIRGDMLYNFWQDAEHPRGIYRRTTWQDYLDGDPTWETVIDIDALARAEDVPWSYSGLSCLPPEERKCMLRLSRGGSDAVEMREFDLDGGTFVTGGFFLPEAKGGVTWLDENTLLVNTDFGEGSLTTSGYPRMVKRWERGTPLSEAELVFEGETDDVSVGAFSSETDERRYLLVYRSPEFFDDILYLYEDGELRKLDLPTDSRPFPFQDRLIVRLRSDWRVGGRSFGTGSVVATDMADFLSGGRDFEVVAEPTDHVAIEGVTPTRDALIVSTLEDVKGRLWRYTPTGDGWAKEQIDAPDFGSVGVAAADVHDDRFFFTYSSFLQPTTLYLADANGAVREVRSMPEMFEADGLVVSQHRAVSKDGTAVPYFQVSPGGLEMDGQNPTLLYGYGGFNISLTPGYSATLGKAWLERGGVYVVANIRGGGEFGPDWWKSAQLEHRQRAYDDFEAVAEDLIARGVTSPDHLGINGGSNGGLLVGVAMTQRPDLFGAVAVDVPLLDMKRYNKLLAGASWMAEYGNPDTDDWDFIKEYSPYQNVLPDREYPRALFYTTTRDDRVHPGHARKMAHRMLDQGHAILYYENTEGGHGAGVTPEQRARMYAIRYTYFHMMLDGEMKPTS